MSDNIQIAAETRVSFGKGAARKLRAAGKVPAVIYGHGEAPTHVALPAHEISLAVRKPNAILDLTLAEGKKLVLVKDIQRDPVRQIIEHLDLVVVTKGEKVTVEVPIHVEGTSFSGTMVQTDHTHITVEAEATHIPEFLVVSVEGMHDGSHITAGDLALPRGATLISDPETLILSVHQLKKAGGSEDEVPASGEAQPSTGE